MRSLMILIKPASGSCNMRCRYCFYADELCNRETALYGVMSAETSHALIDRAFAYADDEVSFAFQGGEPTLAGLAYFRDFVQYIEEKKAEKKLRVHYALQTNGLCLDEEWARFFAENHFLIGVSLDGTKDIHDKYRIDASGEGTFDRISHSLRLLEENGVDFNILTVVTGDSARKAKKVYRFFRDSGWEYQQYIECLDPLGEEPGQHEYSLTPKKYESFLKNLFDAWYTDVRSGKHSYNRYFENLLFMMAGQPPESCNMRGICGRQWVIEADGGVYPCDFYVLDEWLLGNVRTDSFEEMDKKRAELGFIEKSCFIPEECKTCKWYPLCRNGCRRLRGEDGKNYFCTAYKGFFEYAYPRLRELYELAVRNGQ